MKNLKISLNQERISGGLVLEDNSNQGNRLENVFYGILETLRGVWDKTNTAHVLLSIVFYKRLLSLDNTISLNSIKIEEEDRKAINDLNANIIEDKAKAFTDLRYAIINISRQNKQLENIYAPLIIVLEYEEDLMQLARIFLILEDIDFSVDSIPIIQFGFFFNEALNSSSAILDSKDQTSGPNFIYRLLSGLACPNSNETVYDPTAGQGNALIELYRKCSSLYFIAEEKNLNSWALCRMNLLMNGIYNFELFNESALIHSEELAQADLAIGHFPFGQKLDTRLIKNRPYISIPFEVTHSDQTECNHLYIQLMLNQLKPSGRMVSILPLNALFKEGEDKKLREFLIRRDWVEAVITLPSGILYNSSVPLALLALNKEKPVERKSKVLFVNASTLEVNSKSKLYNSLSNEQVDCIINVFRNYRNDCETYLTQHVSVVDLQKIIENRFNLNAKRYAAPFIRELEKLSAEDNLVQLNSIFKVGTALVWAEKSDTTLQNLLFVSKDDIALRFADYQLRLNKLKSFKHQVESEGRLLRNSALLVNRNGNRLRASFFEYRGEPILVSKQLMAFEVDENKIILEYLILQLHAPLFEQQLLTFRSDDEFNNISESAFAQLQIVLPDLKHQDYIIKETKLKLLQEEEQKVENLRHRLNLDKKEAQSKQNKIISSLHHELGNSLPAILNEFKSLRDFLIEKESSGSPLKMNESVFSIYDEDLSSIDESERLSHVLKRIENMLVHSIDSIDATGNIIRAEKENMKMELVDLIEFLEEFAQLYASEKRFNIRIYAVKDENSEIFSYKTLLDKTQMTMALSNLIENAKNHGFDQNKNYQIQFKVGISPDRDELVIEYKNDGQPFPKDFTFQDFISYGRYAGKSGNSGIGGYLINQIIENHDGYIVYREKNDRHDPFNVQLEIVLPVKSNM